MLRKFLTEATPFFAPCGRPAFAKKRIVWNTVLFSIVGKKMVPDNTWTGDKDPIQGAEEQALNCVPIFVGAQSVVFLCIVDTEKNEDTQRQPTAILGQIGNDGVVEHFAVETTAAEQEYKQTGEVDR